MIFFFGPGLALVIIAVVIGDGYGLMNYLLGTIGGLAIVGGIAYYLRKRL